MSNPSRRNFLKDLGLGATGLSVAAGGPHAAQMPGRPSSGGVEPKAGAPSNIMAVAAHPGDAFFAMGAAVALQVHLGGRGLFVSLSLGEKGSPAVPPADYGRLQREAAERAAGALGAPAVFLDYRDGEIPVDDTAKFTVCDLIREYRPGIIITHWRGSWHKDHQACFEIVNDVMFYAGLPAVSRKKPAYNVGRLFFADNWEDAKDFAADTYLDITPVFERWFEACAVFPMWRGENGFRYNDYYGALAVERGCLSGYKYAVALMSPPEQITRRVHAL
jgi:N-acetylglucosamine malate deacetylase 1